MTQSEAVLLNLIRQSLFNIPADLPREVDWSKVFQEAQIQTVAGLVPEKTIADHHPQWRIAWYQIVANSTRILYAQQELISLLSDHGIPSAILKGTAAAIYYPQPCNRTMGDIDIIVPQDQFEAATELMKQSGYVIEHLEDDPDARHIGFAKDGISFELHHHFSHKDLDIETHLTEGLRHVQTASINGSSFPMLPPLENGMVLLEHMREHLKSGMGLRQVIDWMMYVDKVLDDNLWRTRFEACASSVGMDTFAKVTARMCQLYLGLSDRITWCHGADESLCELLMSILLSSGNFGRKQGAGNSVETVTTLIRRNGLFRYLQIAGEHNWKAYKAHRWLKPFCWLYQIFRYCRRGLAAKRGKGLIDDLNRSKTRTDLLKQLNI